METTIRSWAAILLLAGCASGGPIPPEVLANREMCEELKRQLFTDREIRSATIYPRCEPEFIVLNGSVRDIEAWERAERVAASMPGVRRVQNNLRIIGKDSPYSDILRY